MGNKEQVIDLQADLATQTPSVTPPPGKTYLEFMMDAFIKMRHDKIRTKKHEALKSIKAEKKGKAKRKQAEKQRRITRARQH